MQWRSQPKGYVLLPRDEHPSVPEASSSNCDVSAVFVRSNSLSTKSISQASSPFSLLALTPTFPLDIPDQMTPVIQTLNHFHTITYCSVGSEMGQEITRATALDLAVVKPYLMHAVNGIAADHLCHLLPADQHPVQHGQSQLASLYHWQRALSLFRDELSSGATKDNMDALISAVMLICVHQFMHTQPVPDPSTSFLYAPPDQRDDCLRWLQIHHGFTAMQAALGEAIWGSVWNPVFMDSEVREHAVDILVPEAGDNTHRLFLKVCGITPQSSRKNNPYYEALQFLLFLRQFRPDMNRFNKLITFVAVIENDFLRLLLGREKRALVILAHWLALMSQLKQWWIGVRCKSECAAIITFLMHDSDESIRGLLRYPAKTIGIVLTSVDQ